MIGQRRKRNSIYGLFDGNKGGCLGNLAATLISILIFLIPFQLYFNIYGSLSVSVAQLLAVSLFFPSVVKLARQGNTGRLSAGGMTLALAALLSVMALSIVFSSNKVAGVKYFLKWAAAVAAYFVAVANIDNVADVRRYLKAVIAGLFCVSIIAAVEYIAGPDRVLSWFSTNPLAPVIMEPDTLRAKLAALHDNFNWITVSASNVRTIRAFGTFECVIDFTAFIGLGLPFIFWLIKAGSRRSDKLAAVLSAAVVLLVLVLANTRSAFLGAIAAVSAYLFPGFKRWTSRQRIGMSLLIAGCVLGFFLLPGSVQDATVSRLLFRHTDMRFSRPVLWSEALKITAGKPMLGVGLANYDQGFRRYVVDSPDLPPLPAHNNFLQLSAETGIPGAAAFGIIVILGLLISLKIVRSEISEIRDIGWGFIALWTWFIVQSMFNTYLFADKFAMLFWFLVGMNVRLCGFSGTAAAPGRNE